MVKLHWGWGGHVPHGGVAFNEERSALFLSLDDAVNASTSVHKNAIGVTMPFVPFEGVCQVELVFVLGTQICENVFHVHQDTDWDSAGLNSIAGTMRDWWIASVRTHVNEFMRLTKVKARGLASSSDAGIEIAVTTGNAGTNTSQPMPNNAALAVKWSTGLTGRSYRGRTYHMGLSASDVFATNASIINTSFQSAITAAYAALLTAVNIADQSLVVASRLADSMPRTLGVATPIIACTVEGTVDSQRRRLPGRGL